MASCARFGRCREQRNLCATRPEVDIAYRPTRIIVVSVIFPIGSILLFIRQRLGLHHQREKSDRCFGYEGDGALRRQNRVLIWIDGHIPARV